MIYSNKLLKKSVGFFDLPFLYLRIIKQYNHRPFVHWHNVALESSTMS